MKENEEQLLLLAKNEVECVIVGGVAATLHGSSYLTYDLDISYARHPTNLERLARALRSVNAKLRGAPKDLPFIPDAETLQRGLNFTFQTDIGALDLLAEIAGVGGFVEARAGALFFELFGHQFAVLALDKLIASKRAVGRTKDLLLIPELEAILEYQRSGRSPREDR